MSYKAWQYCPGVIAVRIGARLCWKDNAGNLKMDRPEPVYLLDGDLPTSESARRQLAEQIKGKVISTYNALDFISQTWWQDEDDEPQPAKSA